MGVCKPHLSGVLMVVLLSHVFIVFFTIASTSGLRSSTEPAGQSAVNRTVHVTTGDVARCLNHSLTLQVRAVSGSIHVPAVPKSDVWRKTQFCKILITAPTGMILRFDFPTVLSDKSVDIFITNELDPRKYEKSTGKNIACLRDYTVQLPIAFSKVNRVTVRINLIYYLRYSSDGTHLNFTALPRQPQIEIIYTSKSSGYIQSPLWDGWSTPPSGLDSWRQLCVPHGYVMMISVVYMFTPTHNQMYLEIWERDTNGQTFLKYDSDKHGHDINKHMNSNRTLCLRFISGCSFSSDNIGFKFNFSIHHPTRVLQRASSVTTTNLNAISNADFYDRGDLWNCSVPFWQDFEPLFPCNSRWNCVNGEDEVQCPYTNMSACGTKGQIWVSGRCYQQLGTGVSRWKDAALACIQRGGLLASFNTAEEWNSVERYISLETFEQTFIGLKSFAAHIGLMYSQLWQWEDQTTAFYSKGTILDMSDTNACGLLIKTGCELVNTFLPCKEISVTHAGGALCEFSPLALGATPWRRSRESPGIQLADHQCTKTPVTLVACASDNGQSHQSPMTHDFLACDPASECLVKSGDVLSAACSQGIPATFPCKNNMQHVPYSVVCDHRADCSDNSDETFCVFPSCDASASFHCGDGQCIPLDQECDFMVQCVSGMDEALCLKDDLHYKHDSTLLPPAIVQMGVNNLLTIVPVNTTNGEQATKTCPSTHFECLLPGYYCLPVYLRCNGVRDCPGHEDEADCYSYTCPGYYRCRNSKICLHMEHVCDGKYGQCPQNDDEWLCGFTCPTACRCQGLAFSCNHSMSARNHPELRSLNADRSNMTLQDLEKNTMLVYLSLIQCSLYNPQVPHLPNLLNLDISDNLFTHLHTDNFQGIQNLQVLKLSGNPFHWHISFAAIIALTTLHELDLSRVYIPELNPSSFEKLLHLHTLNLSHSSLHRVLGDGFQPLKSLQSLDFRLCPLTTFPRPMLKGLEKLKSVFASNYKICCPVVLPENLNVLCLAPTDEISSCTHLLGSDEYRVVLAILVIFSLLGNSVTVLYHLHFDKHVRSLGFGVLMIHLCISNFLMGVYQAIVGVADLWYGDSYLWYDLQWKESTACQSAGFLCIVSSEVSIFLICTCTVYVLTERYVPSTYFRFGYKLAHVTSLASWITGFAVAAIPTLPTLSHWQFYSHTGICIPFLSTSTHDVGHAFAFGVFNVLNVILMLAIAIGHAFISWSSRSDFLAFDNVRKASSNVTVTRRLCTVATSDCLCWCAFGLLAILNLTDVSLSREVHVAMITYVLPLNSALNPILYAISTVLERRRKTRQKRLLVILSRRQDVK